jgi:hypothetical protein
MYPHSCANTVRKYIYKDYELLRSLPGIRGIVACSILFELDNLGKLGSLKHFAACRDRSRNPSTR